MFLQEAYTTNHMKRYVPIIIGVVALCAVLYLGSSKMTSNDEALANEESASSVVTNKSFQGSITKVFEGDNTLDYGFDLPSTATATVSMDGALVKVTEMDASVLAMYVSFEGGRGYSPSDYITNNIIPKVSGITQVGTTSISGYDWTVVESANSEWHVASVENGNWLLVVENKKADTEKAMSILGSVAVSSPKAAISETSETKELEGEQKTNEEASTSDK
jgi:hypothetical protein